MLYKNTGKGRLEPGLSKPEVVLSTPVFLSVCFCVSSLLEHHIMQRGPTRVAGPGPKRLPAAGPSWPLAQWG